MLTPLSTALIYRQYFKNDGIVLSVRYRTVENDCQRLNDGWCNIAISLIDRVADADGLDGLFARSTQAIKMAAVTLWLGREPVDNWKVPTLPRYDLVRHCSV